MHRQVTITRQKLVTHGQSVAWRWCYSVAPVHGQIVSIGTLLSSAIAWAKAHSQNANEIVQAWDNKRIPMPRRRAAAWAKVIPDSFTPNKIDCGEFLLWSYMRPVGHPKSAAAVLGGYAPIAREWAYAIKDKTGTFFDVAHSVNGFASKEQAEHHARYKSPAGRKWGAL